MKLQITKAARDFLSELQAKQFRQVMISILQLLTDPHPHDSKQLKGYPYYRVDVGEYRVVYETQADEVHVLLVGKRNDDEVYRLLKRMKG